METKYVVIKVGNDEIMMVFSSLLDHAHIDYNFEIVSAGFIGMDSVGRWYCYGESKSLKIKSRSQDSAIANRQLPRLHE